MKLKHKLCDENEENPDKDIADKIDVGDDCNGAKPTYAWSPWSSIAASRIRPSNRRGCEYLFLYIDKNNNKHEKQLQQAFQGGEVLWMPLLHGYFYAEVLVCGKHIFWPFCCFMISVWIQPPVWSKVATEWWLGILTWRNPCRRAACPSRRRWRWWCRGRRSGWTAPPPCSSWSSRCRLTISTTLPAWTPCHHNNAIQR